MFQLIVLLLSLVINVLLGLFVLLKNSRSTTNRMFLVLTSCFSAWALTNYISVHPFFFPQLIWVRLVIFFAALLNLAVYLTFRVFPRLHFRPRDRQPLIATLGTGIVMGATLTPIVISGIIITGTSIKPIVAPGMALLLAQTIILLGLSAYGLLRKFQKASGIERQQLKYLVLGIVGTFSCILISNLMLPVIFSISVFVPLGAAYTLIFSFSCAYAILRHRLLDIRGVVARSAAYILLLTTLGTTYGAVAFAIEQTLYHGAVNNTTQRIANIVLALILAVVFQPLRRLFERLTNQLFFRDGYDSQIVVNDFTQVLVTELDLDTILKLSLARLCDDLKIGFGQIIVFNHDRVYRIEHFGPLPKKLLVAPQLFKLGHGIVVEDELEGGDRKALMSEHGVRLAAHLRTRNEHIGYLLLGDKLSGDIYSDQDIKLLKIVAGELAVAIQNAKAYAEIREFNVTLQERVDRATSRLRVANRHLKDLDRAKDEFLSMASHQLRTPLTTIKGYLSMIIEGDAGEISDVQREYTNYAFESSRRMVGLISDLLNVSRLSAGKFMIETKPTNMAEVVADEVRQLQSHAEAKNLDLIFENAKKAMPEVEIDENKTRQVIMNFIDNAIYYTQSGSVTVRLAQAHGLIRLTVKDTGIGVPEEARKKLFSKFYRAENAQSVRPDGTGLGLYLAKRVIEDQGGTIIFESNEGEGSTFGFELPIRVSATRQQVKS